MKYLNKILLIAALFLNTAVNAQIEIRHDTRKFLIPQADSLEKFIQLNKIDYALITYSASNWISIDYIFYALVRKKQTYYLMRLANLEDFRKNAKLKVSQKKLTRLEAQDYLKKIAPAVAFKYTEQDYRNLPRDCTIINGIDTVNVNVIYDAGSLNIFQYTKNSKIVIEAHNPFYYLKNCYPYNPEFGILKGFVNTYEKITELVQEVFKNDPISSIHDRSRLN